MRAKTPGTGPFQALPPEINPERGSPFSLQPKRARALYNRIPRRGKGRNAFGLLPPRRSGKAQPTWESETLQVFIQQCTPNRAADRALPVAPRPAPVGAEALGHIPFQETSQRPLNVGLRLRSILVQLGFEVSAYDAQRISLFLVRHIVHCPPIEVVNGQAGLTFH